MENVLTIKRAAVVGKVSRNGRLITRDAWEMAMDDYKRRNPEGSISVTLGCRLHDGRNHSMEEAQSIDLSTVVGSTIAVGLGEIDVYIKSAEKYKMVKEFVENLNYVAGLRYIGKVKRRELSEKEKKFYETKSDCVTEVHDITIIAFDLIPYSKLVSSAPQYQPEEEVTANEMVERSIESE